jgi:hypothetical protein
LAILSSCKNRARELEESTEELATTYCPNKNVSDLLSAWKWTIGDVKRKRNKKANPEKI